MVSIWWVALAFVLGGFAGLLIYAFMDTSAGQSERAARADEDVRRTGLGDVNLEEHWTM